MLNEMTLICLLCLVIAHGFLIKGCFKINDQIPTSTEAITSQFETTSNLLNELCDIIAELTPASQNTTSQNTAMGGSIGEILSSLLISKMTMSQEHGPQTHQREILEIDPTQNESQTENESHELGS
jgi:hypothetical protein